MTEPLRVALLSYRSHPEVGGQGVYVRSLGRALTDLGHQVTVFSGPPYPVLDPPTELRSVASLDLYRPDDPFRRPRRHDLRGPIDVFEYLAMCTGAFPEPLTFSLRVARAVRAEGGFDVIHDNQTLGYGLLPLKRNFPVVATVHHPISIDRRVALSQEDRRAKRIGIRRWYAFVEMQKRVARRMPHLAAVSTAARDDLIADFGVRADRVRVIPNGVDTDLFRPLDLPREAGHIVAIASSDQPSKGLQYLVEAVAKLATERDVRLSIVGRGGEGAHFAGALDRFGLRNEVSILGRLEPLALVATLNRAEVAVVPSLYEGFSLPAIEAMAAGTPLVATTGGAIPEVLGDAGLLVPPGDSGALAHAIGRVLDDRALRSDMSSAGRSRALERFSWRSAAESWVDLYREAIRAC